VRPLVGALLHAMVHERLDAYGPADGPRPPLWLTEGLAERMSVHGEVFSDQERSLELKDVEGLSALLGATRDRGQRIAAVRPLKDLTAIGTLADLDVRVAGMDVPAGLPLAGLAHEASLFLAWLDDGDREHPDRGSKLVGEWLAHRTGAPPALKEAPESLEPAFVGWLQGMASQQLRQSRNTTLSLLPPTLAPGEIRLGVPARPEDLALPGSVTAVERARLLQLAVHGDLASAVARCTDLLRIPDLPAVMRKGASLSRRTKGNWWLSVGQ